MLMFTRIVNAFGGEALDRFGKIPGVIGNLDLLNLLAADMENRFVAFSKLRFEGGLLAINVEALDVLAGGVEEKAGDFEAEVLIADAEMGGFEGERRTVFGNQFFVDAPGTQARNVVGF